MLVYVTLYVSLYTVYLCHCFTQTQNRSYTFKETVSSALISRDVDSECIERCEAVGGDTCMMQRPHSVLHGVLKTSCCYF